MGALCSLSRAIVQLSTILLTGSSSSDGCIPVVKENILAGARQKYIKKE